MQSKCAFECMDALLIHLLTCVRTRAHIHTHTNTHTCIDTHMHRHTHTPRCQTHECPIEPWARVETSKHPGLAPAHTFTALLLLSGTRAFVREFVYLCICVCMFVCVCFKCVNSSRSKTHPDFDAAHITKSTKMCSYALLYHHFMYCEVCNPACKRLLLCLFAKGYKT